MQSCWSACSASGQADFSNLTALSGVWQNAQVVGDSFERFIEVLEDLQDGEVPDEETVDSLLSEMHENVEAVGESSWQHRSRHPITDLLVIEQSPSSSALHISSVSPTTS